MNGTKHDYHIAGLILARGNSKGICKKNMRLLAGLPLIAWAIRPMKDANAFDSVWVSTDDDDIASFAAQWGATVHKRSSETASDKSTSLAAVKEFLRYHSEVDVVGLVQCTSPCLHPQPLINASKLIREQGYDSVFSVTRQHKLRWQEQNSEGENCVALNFDPANRPRRQDWSGELIESGHFYFAKTSLINQGYLQGGRCRYIELSPEVCIEIDGEQDWAFAELAVKLYGYHGMTS